MYMGTQIINQFRDRADTNKSSNAIRQHRVAVLSVSPAAFLPLSLSLYLTSLINHSARCWMLCYLLCPAALSTNTDIRSCVQNYNRQETFSIFKAMAQTRQKCSQFLDEGFKFSCWVWNRAVFLTNQLFISAGTQLCRGRTGVWGVCGGCLLLCSYIQLVETTSVSIMRRDFPANQVDRPACYNGFVIVELLEINYEL